MQDNGVNRRLERVVEIIDYCLEHWQSLGNKLEDRDMYGVLESVKNQLLGFDFEAVNAKLLDSLVNCLEFYLTHFYEILEKQGDVQNTINFQEYVILYSQLTSVIEMLQASNLYDSNDLYGLDLNHDRWLAIQAVSLYDSVGDPHTINKKIQNFIEKIQLGHASVHQSASNNEENEANLISVGYHAASMVFNKDRFKRLARLFHSQSDIESFKFALGFLERKSVQLLMEIELQRIHTNEVIFLPRIQSSDQLYSYIQNNNQVQARVLCSQPVKNLTAKQQSIFGFCCGRRQSQDSINYDKVVFHIHGGGFICMSSASHQNYLRQWAKSLNVPIISIDYRLAPENPYPDALNDVWNAYVWLVKNGEQIGITAKRIVVTGDSSGGNLALALTIKAIQERFRVPDGLLLSYPAVILDRDFYSPSYLISLDDYIISHSFIKLCAESYVRGDPKTDPLLSPLVCDLQTLSKFPKTKFIVGNQDPISDHTFRMADRLIQAGVKTEIGVFEGMLHGSLNLDVKIGVPECKKIVRFASSWLKNMLR